MDRFVPSWNTDDGSRCLSNLLHHTNQKKSTGPDNELVELLWRNGHVVMQSQTHRKPTNDENEFKQAQKPKQAPKFLESFGTASSTIQEDETASWFPYTVEDPLETEFFMDFFCEMPPVDCVSSDKSKKDVAEPFKKQSTLSSYENGLPPKPSVLFQGNMMPPPKSHVISSYPPNCASGSAAGGNLSPFPRPVKANMGLLNQHPVNTGSVNRGQIEVGESPSMISVGLSACGSNQVPNQADRSRNISNDITGSLAKEIKESNQISLPRGRTQTDPYETTVTSSSGGSGSSFGRSGMLSASNQGHKRKGGDMEELESQSEEAEYESIDANKPAQRSASARRSRASEVHNLSERRRRDRINEKMRALQELIPHCNKSDKASMLDEAIEYLKALQLQVQIMWMGSGMAPMMFPSVQQYMSRVGIGMGHVPMTSVPHPVQLPGVPMVNQISMPSSLAANHASPALNTVSFPKQMQNVRLPEPCAQYLGLHQMQPTPPVMNLYPYGSHIAQPNQAAGQVNVSSLPSEAVHFKNNQNGKSG